MSKTLYFDCFSGISGDMTVAALLDLGLEARALENELKRLALTGYELAFGRQARKGISGTDFQVILNHHEKHHNHRNLYDIESLIADSALDDGIKTSSIKAFRLLAEAEARIHLVDIDKIHFHEVGAIDAIIDIVGTSICMHWLDADRVMASAINTGGGFVDCAHGRLPVPAPATLELLKGFAIYNSGIQAELATPTGAVILKTYCTGSDILPEMKIQAVGYGCGKKELEFPNLLRVVLGEAVSEGPLWIIETNIDDMNPEFYSYLFPLLLEKGALDVFVTPTIMKKNRPGQILSLICRQNLLPDLEDIVFRQTSTFGLRKYPVQREELERETRMIDTRYGPVPVKYGRYRGDFIKFSPEYDACKKIAASRDKPLPLVYQEILSDIKPE